MTTNRTIARTLRAAGLAVALCACALMLCACDDEDATHRWLPQAAATGRRVALIDAHNDQLRLFGVAQAAGGTLPSWTIDLPEAPYALWERAGGSRDLLVAAGGEPGGEQTPVLVRITAGGELREHPLAARYDALAQSEDGAFALAHFAPGAQRDPAASGQLAVIALDGRGPAREVALEHDGQPWSELWLSPALALDDGVLHVAASSHDRTLGLLALEHAAAGPRFVTLTGARARSARPRQLAAIPEQGRLAWLAEGLDDVFVARLRSADADPGFAFELAQLPAGAGPVALAVGANAAGAPVLLLVTGGGRELRVLDPERGEGPALELDAPARAIAACTPGCAHALLYAPGAPAATLVDVAAAADGEHAALRLLQLPGALAAVSLVQDGARRGPYALGRQAAGGATWIDLEAGRLHDVALGAAETQSAQLGRDGGLWIAAPGSELVTRIDPERGARASLQLEAPLARLVLVPEADLAVVVHAGSPLALSVLPATAPARDDVALFEDLP